MKRLYAILIAVFAIIQISYGQNSSPWPSSGNVGIGINTGLTVPLTVQGGSTTTGLANIATSLTTKFNTANPAVTLGVGYISSDNPFLQAFNNANSNPNSLIINPFGGNVGIGTTSPLQKLVSTGAILNVGITGNNNGVAYTSFTDGFYSALHSAAPTEGVGMWSDNQGNASIGALYDNIGSSLNLTVRSSSSAHGLVAIKIGGNGNVGIGTLSPDAKLAVKGTIHTQEVKVDMNGWSDFVFDKTYRLPTLSSIKTYIDQNHHLPEIPSEAEVIKNGVNLGEMVKLQTKKIEELTLYLIEKDKQVAHQQNQIANQSKLLTDQQKQLTDQQKVNRSLQQQINQLAKQIKN